MRLIIGISGASGVVMGYRLLQELQKHDTIETHLIVSKSAQRTFELETDIEIARVLQTAEVAYRDDDLAAKVSSGSFVTAGMVVVPCSMKTLSGIAHGFDENLLIRAANVCLKEGRKVVLVPREMPLSAIHLRNLLNAKEGGCSILPPLLTFYHQAETLDAQIDHLVGKILMQFGVEASSFHAWGGA